MSSPAHSVAPCTSAVVAYVFYDPLPITVQYGSKRASSVEEVWRLTSEADLQQDTMDTPKQASDYHLNDSAILQER